jgi:tetratricopeptide (TPR) repeat protein
VVDLSALTSAWLGNYSLARNIYMAQYNLARVPYAALTGSPAHTAIPVVHPAYSLEILTGAYIEAGKHALARQLTKELMEMRQQLFGVNSELYAGILANSANLYRKEGNLAKAEEISKEALLISRGVLKNTGMGQIITQVADNLRDQGKYSEAEPLYVEALQMREKQFGPGSVKAAETLVEYARLLRARGQLALADEAKARRYEERSAEIFKRHETKNDPIASMLVTALFFLVSIVVSKILFGPRGYLTKVAMRRLEQNLNTVSEPASAVTVTEAGAAAKHNASNSRENIGKLIKFYENQNNIEQVEKYRNMLAGIGKD